MLGASGHLGCLVHLPRTVKLGRLITKLQADPCPLSFGLPHNPISLCHVTCHQKVRPHLTQIPLAALPVCSRKERRGCSSSSLTSQNLSGYPVSTSLLESRSSRVPLQLPIVLFSTWKLKYLLSPKPCARCSHSGLFH